MGICQRLWFRVVGGLRAGHVVEVLVNAEGEFLQVGVKRIFHSRVEHGHTCSVFVRQDGIIQAAAILAAEAFVSAGYPSDAEALLSDVEG